MKSSKLKVSHVKISNILGVEELEFAPGGFCEVTGANGSGKSSVLSALKAALSGGHDASLLRNGSEKGEIVLVLDDGTQIKKTIKAGGTDVKVLRDEKVVKQPASVIAALHDVLSVNPVDFLRAPEKQRVDALLQVMPIKIDRGWLLDQADVSIDAEPVELKKLDGIDLIEAVKKIVFDERTGVNRAARDKEGTINQLRATLPAEIADAPETDQSLLAELNRIDAARDGELRRITDKLVGLKAASDARIEALQAEVVALQDKIAAEKAAFVEVKGKAQAAESEARTAHAQARAGVEAQTKQIEEAQKAHTRFKQTQETVARLVIELDALKREGQGHTEALEALDAYKAELLADLPIPGLEVIEGKLLRNGIPFDRINTAGQVEIAVEIAKLRAGELGLICVDGLELLDAGHYDAFRDMAEKSGLQMIVSRVGTGPLHIHPQTGGF